MTIALFITGLFVVAALTTAAAAVRSVSRIWLRHWTETRLAGGGAASSSLDEIQRLLLAASTAVALVAFATGAVVGARGAASSRELIEHLATSALLVLVIGQLVPRAIGRRWSMQLVPVLVPALRFVSVLLTPFVAVAQAAASATRPRGMSAIPAPTGEHDALKEILREGEVEGVGDAGESAIISGVVDFTDKRVQDIMTPRAEIFSVERARPMVDVAKDIAHAKYTRVPVTDGGIDHIAGMYHAFDVLKWEAGPPPPIRPVAFARETALASELLFRLLRERTYLAVIQDATGRTLGVVTIEDFLEELVGDIRDEHDEPAPAT